MGRVGKKERQKEGEKEERRGVMCSNEEIMKSITLLLLFNIRIRMKSEKDVPQCRMLVSREARIELRPEINE